MDGIWCPKCRDFHPTLMWHDKYDDYLAEKVQREHWEKMKRERPQMVGDAALTLNRISGVAERGDTGPCVVCGCRTHFVVEETGERVCSDECLDVLGRFEPIPYPR